jgi:peroxiredoxin
MAIAAGERIPNITLKTMTADGIADVNLTDVLADRKVILFGLPGAYTPVCSTQHLPGYVAESDRLKANGVGEIGCISVNDPFVMDAWGEAHGAAGKVLMLSDAEATFTRAIGMSLDLSKFGCGERSQRYSLVVENGVVTEVNVEESIFDHEASAATKLLAPQAAEATP